MFWLNTISQKSSVYSIQTVCQMVLALSWKRSEGCSSILCCINHQERISWPEQHRLPLPWLWLKRLRRFWTATSLSGRSNSLHKGGVIGIGSWAPSSSSIGAISKHSIHQRLYIVYTKQKLFLQSSNYDERHWFLSTDVYITYMCYTIMYSYHKYYQQKFSSQYIPLFYILEIQLCSVPCLPLLQPEFFVCFHWSARPLTTICK